MSQLYRNKDSVDVYLFIALIIYSILAINYMMHWSGKLLPKHNNLKLRILSSVQDDCDSGSEFLLVSREYPSRSFDSEKKTLTSTNMNKTAIFFTSTF